MWKAISVFVALLLSPVSEAQIPLLNPDGGQHNCGQCTEPSESQRTICATDGRSYTQCELAQAQCLGYRVKEAHSGKCSGKRCLAQQAQARTQNDLFIPDCNADGSFKSIQCHNETNHCWCVDTEGKILAGSTVYNKQPNCKRFACSPGERATFTTNLANAILKELTFSSPGAEATLSKAAEKKFRQLDRNQDQFLDPMEYRDFKRLLKRIITPKSCARIFLRLTDLDGDEHISFKEWNYSLGVDEAAEKEHSSNNDETATIPSFTDESEEFMESETTEESTRETEDCNTARQTAIERLKSGHTYVPACTPENTYKEQQCHLEVCWCVAPKTGKPIQGTTHNKTMVTDCSSAKLKAKTSRGCPVKRKKQFSQNLASLFYTQKYPGTSFEQAKHRTNISSVRDETLLWKFGSLDLNKNGRLERDEWKIFRREWKNAAPLNSNIKRQQRKCWRNMIKFCDENEDRLVLRDEWLQCSGQTTLQNKNSADRKGKNPFVDILKS